MRPTEILMSEHRVIEQMLAVLERIAAQACETGALPAQDCDDAVAFLRTFADACHHGKEEARLFPAMERAGLPPFAGPTAVMRQEHEMGRDLVRRMAEAAEAARGGDREAPARFATAARGFVHLLREHIAKEDQVLFPMADQILSPEAQAELATAFESFEHEDMGPGTHERLLEVADRLARTYGVTPAEAAAKAHVCSCSHAAAGE